jgi:hypothetical protein
MNTKQLSLVFVFISLGFWAGCGPKHSVLLNQEARASLSSVRMASVAPGRTIKEETSPEIRSEVLKAVRTFMTRVGRYPQRSVEDSALSILEPMSAGALSDGVGFAYRAVVRLDRAFAASQLVEFVVFERGGKLVVKKISL